MGIREKILSAVDLARSVVDVPEWGCSITVRSLTYAERARYLRESDKQDAAREQLRKAQAQPDTVALGDPLPEPEPTEGPSAFESLGDYLEAEGHLAALALRLGAIDAETGEQLFSDEDLSALAAKNPDTIERVAGVILSMSALTADSEARAEGNSGATRSGSLSFDSASLSDAPQASSDTPSPAANSSSSP